MPAVAMPTLVLPAPPTWPDAARYTRWSVDPAGQCRGESGLRLSGLRCAACAGIVEAALAAVEGVESARVHAASERAWVRWDPARTTPEALLAAVRRAGYDAAPDRAAPARALRRAEGRSALWRLFVAGFCAMQVMMLATPGYVSAPGEIAPDLQRLLDWGGWLMTLPVLLFSAAPFFAGAWRALRQHRIGMDLPVALGIAVTFVASSGAAFDPGGLFGREVFFDSLTMFVAFLLAGRWFEMRLRHRAAESLEAGSGALPETALRLRADGTAESVAIEQLAAGDLLRVPVGEAFAADGVLLEGQTRVDEALLSGESRPLAKAPGAAVVGGSINLGAPVLMRVERCGADTRHEAIVALMREAATQRPAAAGWAERWAAPFLWTVLLLAGGAAAVWSVIDPSRAVWVAVSVLIVTCPCALSLATPSALLAAAQGLARQGVLLRRVDALERLAGMDRLFLDKTGTLTNAQPQFARVERVGQGGGLESWDLLRNAAALAAWSSHPLSRALCAAAPHAPVGTAWREVREQAGGGVEALDAQGARWRLGSAAWVGTPPQGTVQPEPVEGRRNSAAGLRQAQPERSGGPCDPGTVRPEPERQGGQHDPAGEGLVTWLARDGVVLARLHFDESLNDDAAAAIDALRADGVAISLLSGDAPGRVQRLAARLGLAAADALGGASPEDKLRAVEEAQVLAHARGGWVGMVGDGLNDAPVLARADVSFAMGEGALLSRAQADAVIVSNRLDDLVHARALAQRALRVIRQNIAWAATYNAICVPLALAGALPPWAAGLGMATSSLLVVGNSMRLQRP